MCLRPFGPLQKCPGKVSGNVQGIAGNVAGNFRKSSMQNPRRVQDMRRHRGVNNRFLKENKKRIDNRGKFQKLGSKDRLKQARLFKK